MLFCFSYTYGWASLVAQKVKNLPEMWETLVQSLVGEDPSGNPLQYSCLENFIDRGAWWSTVHGGHRESDNN